MVMDEEEFRALIQQHDEDLRALIARLAESGDDPNVIYVLPHRLCGNAKERARLLARYSNVRRRKRK